ncbi:multiheme c-type cytochrome [Rhodopirellula halodulae]|uniref:multiheme c-type cytochrome n=1 Tax=Rhodopirellula halodulae TaxID=2894198 RepID=UPI001E583746|nr:multiheme c-type cytochrome [Rhodopirellula sp. JC737]MCC9657556.1 cytochrome C [Rhodopirellula sp. JC737]
MPIIPRRETITNGLMSLFAAIGIAGILSQPPSVTADDGSAWRGQPSMSDEELLQVGELLGVGNRLYGRQPAARIATAEPAHRPTSQPTPSAYRHPTGGVEPSIHHLFGNQVPMHSVSANDAGQLAADVDPLGDFGDDPLAGLGSEEPISPPAKSPDDAGKKDPHEDLWTEDCYPSAESCRACHPKHYDEWSVSSHAYASVSPMFQRFEQAMTELTEGTVGHFCMRCHSPVATQLNIPRTVSVLDQPPVAREGVTCISCHRINEHYGRSNGDRRIEPGNIHAPVGSGGNGAGLAKALANAEKNKLKTDASQKGTGQAIHNGSYFFEPLTKTDICISCHQVAVHPGIWLEVVHAQYRSGPAAKAGISCQDCHMGAVPGKAEGYEECHVAELSGKPYGEPRKHSNHTFWGPGYSIAHPGIFPHNPKAKAFTPRQWLTFDDRAGWGTEAFEKNVPDGMHFPKPWDNADDRRDARKVIDTNIAKMNEKRGYSAMTLEAGAHVSDPMFYTKPQIGMPLKLGYRVDNISTGHNLPTGSLGAQPQLWLNAVLINPNGQRVWETGYLDANADLCDMHSVEVAKGRIPRDKNLFNLQTKFLINNVRGTDREAALPLNFSLDQLAFLRPGALPISVLNHPPLIRMEAHSIPPLDHRIAKYTIPAEAFRVPGPYRLSVRMRSRTEPMYFMRQINSTPDMIRRMNERMIDICHGSHTFMVR